ncbi:undecaprenyl diphosphate synthase [Weissella uvarum]|uniref:isoprenyl transferase n=1 Tax=Weissella uvarum TaxID=1479233 RepID=UPI0019613826|nr:isoprenyl transferase [Weissella uvarum]MBM7617714.1 undecaprenyl diphosphate synthase [Weissella uvarum]MCM0596063.1 isoprenyl transferase [Weissella uvarum]
MIFNRSQAANSKNELLLDENNIPNHVAMIMDGNGRWAKQRNMPRVAGHQRGMEVVKTIAKAAATLGVKVLTLYAFSTENWKRPEDEVSFLMKLPGRFFDTFVPELIENNIRVEIIGELEGVPADTQKAVLGAVEQTAQNTGMVLNFALNYGSRTEIVDAVKEIAAQVADGTIAPTDISEATISQHLMTQELGEYADPDVIIRTGGEERLSNFLMWQAAYSELIFIDTLWPDLDADGFNQAMLTYQQRHRRFGGLAENKSDKK